MASKTVFCVMVVVVVAVAVVEARKLPLLDNRAEPSLENPAFIDTDLVPAASGHHGHGRVHIKVYRGPSDGHHAAHGFWVKQPADDHRN